MSGWHRQGRARISATGPQALGVCDRCAFTFNLVDLKFQYQYQGFTLQNLQILVCDECLDAPQEQLRAIILPPDPAPVMNPRSEPYSSEVPSYRVTEESNRRVTEGGQPRVTEGIPPNG